MTTAAVVATGSPARSWAGCEEGPMALFDKVKAQAAQVAQMAQEAGKAGQARIGEAQARKRADELLRSLGAAVLALHTGRGDEETSGEIDTLVQQLTELEQEHGPIAAPDSSDAAPDGEVVTGAPQRAGLAPLAAGQGSTTPPAGAAVPEGGFRLGGTRASPGASEEEEEEEGRAPSAGA